MKKLIAIFAVLLFVAPAFAADWSFYGSQRMATWYTSQDFGKNQVAGQDNDAGTQWYFQGNSRFGAKVKADKVTGQIEMGLNALNGGDGGDDVVKIRRAYGVWKFSDMSSLKVGKDYAAVTDFISNQWFDGDNDMLGEGNFYGKRPAFIGLNIGDFEIDFLTPGLNGTTGGVGQTNTGINLPVTAQALPAQTGATGDPDVYFPRIEANYNLKLGAGYIKPFAGFQYYTVNSSAPTQNVTDSIDVFSYVLGVSTSWNIGAFSIGGQLSYGMNEGLSGWSSGYNVSAAQLPVLKAGGDKIADVYTIQALIVPALKVTDTLRFEAGLGYRQDNADGAPGYSLKDESWVGYVQAMITLAPGVYLCPEIGYIDYMDNRAGDDEGYKWYAGAKWQIDF
jgi:hypothetical protein